MAPAAIGKDTDDGEKHVEGGIVFCFEHVTYAAVGEVTFEDVGTVGREEAKEKARGGGLFSSGGRDGVGVLENAGADENERMFGLEGAGSCENRF